jgi:probable HAF family extracellular repeat protein
VILSAGSVVSASQFLPLGDFPEGGFQSLASSISGDGSTIVGAGSRMAGLPHHIYITDAFRWSQAYGLINLQSLPFLEAPITAATALSFDGSVIVGGRTNQFHNDPLERSEAWRWTETEGFVGLGYLNNVNGTRSDANDVSADGSVIVGSSDSSNGFGEAFYWTQESGMVGLGDLPGGYFQSWASAVSADGNFIVGTGQTDVASQAFRWHTDTGMVAIDLPAGFYGSSASDISSDGRVVVGDLFSVTSSGSRDEPFLWTETTGIQPLGDLPGGAHISSAAAVSADGSIVVGQSSALPPESMGDLGVGDFKAFVWDELHGMRDLQDVLINEYGLGSGLAGWQLIRAVDISQDGLSIVGSGFNPNGDIEAWLVRLDRPLVTPEPASLALLLVGVLPLIAVRQPRQFCIT